MEDFLITINEQVYAVKSIFTAGEILFEVQNQNKSIGVLSKNENGRWQACSDLNEEIVNYIDAAINAKMP